MKTRKTTILIPLTVALFAMLTAFTTSQALAQKKSAVLKIGTYDSRIIIFAWSRSDLLKQHLAKIGQKSDSAQKIHDTARLKELSVEAMSFQHLLHQLVFSNGSVSSFMKVVKDKLPELAKKEGVSIIVSKWELNYNDPSCEVIDLTSQVAALFQPKEDISKMAGEITGQAPVPIEELGIEMDMLDQYCTRFGKK